ncbi:hypothetical protein [Demequina litorisediminis]|uniref:Uncharacterized protein n=1 Tax=Demequina litorisediminis TaxID=1849022 RepID=A0ABQ6IIS5_9MICO|nr:hypothetical protein [Demequina litorisediminis]GMA37823.1 hypothetical protein GCM10025876_40270 [Demequina litorisediminis]
MWLERHRAVRDLHSPSAAAGDAIVRSAIGDDAPAVLGAETYEAAVEYARTREPRSAEAELRALAHAHTSREDFTEACRQGVDDARYAPGITTGKADVDAWLGRAESRIRDLMQDASAADYPEGTEAAAMRHEWGVRPLVDPGAEAAAEHGRKRAVLEGLLRERGLDGDRLAQALARYDADPAGVTAAAQVRPSTSPAPAPSPTLQRDSPAL